MSAEPRGAIAREAALDQVPADQVRHMWKIYITHPGFRASRIYPPAASTAPDHRPTVLHLVVDEPQWHQKFRGTCLGCHWESEDCNTEADAVEAAHDHCWHGWRDLPAVRQPKSGYERWLAEVKHSYPDGWFDRGGPIRTLRPDGRGMRHAPGRAPGGGYEMAVRDYRPKKAGHIGEQPLLPFD